MSIRRDLLLRSALLRQPDMPPLPPLRAVAIALAPPMPARRGAKAAPRRRTQRSTEGKGYTAP